MKTGILDKNGVEIKKCDSVRFFHHDLKKIEDHKNNPGYSGEWVTCTVDFQFGMFGLLWPGKELYFNKWPLNGSRLEVVNPPPVPLPTIKL